MSEPTRIPSRVWSAAYHEFRSAGVKDAHAMARADIVRIECERAIEAEAALPSVEALAKALHEAGVDCNEFVRPFSDPVVTYACVENGEHIRAATRILAAIRVQG